jgi:Tfp pilus assembly protein PilF
MEKIEKLRSFLAVSPADSFLNHALALEYIKQGNDEEARQIFIGILEREPGYVGSYYHLGRLLERMGEIDLAKTWYEKGMAVAENQGDKHAFNELRAAHEDITE